MEESFIKLVNFNNFFPHNNNNNNYGSHYQKPTQNISEKSLKCKKVFIFNLFMNYHKFKAY